jgi:hypothetical protein
MDRKYDLFEKFPDGAMIWRGTVAGHENAIRKLQEFAATTENECCVMHLPEKAVIASMNTPKSQGASVNENDHRASAKDFLDPA